MNRALVISTIALVAVVMVMGTVSVAMAGPGASGGKVVPHKSDHTSTGAGPADDCTAGKSGNTGKLWFVDISGEGNHDAGEPTFCLKPKP